MLSRDKLCPTFRVIKKRIITMSNLKVDLYLFVINSNECFRKVVEKKEKRVDCDYLTLFISVFKLKFLKVWQLIPPDAYSTGLSYIPNCECKSSALF